MSYAKKILVTGGTGYIGSHTVVELAENGYEPIVVDNFSNSHREVVNNIEKITGHSITIIEADCANYDEIEAAISSHLPLEGIIHFAAYKAVGESVAEPLKYYHNNVGSMLSVLRLMEVHTIPSLVFSSSCTVYGQPEELPVTEESPFRPAESPYGRTKQICEDIIRDWKKAQNSFKTISLRYFNPIGAHNSALIGELPIGAPNNLVPYITQTAAGIRDQITIFGNDYNTPDGTCIRDYIHVVDLAKAHVNAIDYLRNTDKGVHEDINLGTGNGNSVLEVVQAFENANDISLNYKIGKRRPGDVESVYANPAKAEKILNWRAELSLEQALRDAWKWQQSLK